MDIIWHGHSCVTLKGEDATIVCDAYSGLGSKLPALKADIATYGDHLAEEKGERAEVEGARVFDWPGEFESTGVSMEGFSAARHAKEGNQKGEDVNIYVFAIDGIKVCHLSGLSHPVSPEVLDHIGDVDVLLLPVGGGPVMDAKTAMDVMESVEPRVCVPYYHNAADSSLEIGGVEAFLKEVGALNIEEEKKFTLKGRSALPEGNMTFVKLAPQLG